MRLGPREHPTTFRLRHYTGNTFSFETIGENATGLSAAKFRADSHGHVRRVRLAFYDTTGLGTFTRR